MILTFIYYLSIIVVLPRENEDAEVPSGGALNFETTNPLSTPISNVIGVSYYIIVFRVLHQSHKPLRCMFSHMRQSGSVNCKRQRRSWNPKPPLSSGCNLIDI